MRPLLWRAELAGGPPCAQGAEWAATRLPGPGSCCPPGRARKARDGLREDTADQQEAAVHTCSIDLGSDVRSEEERAERTELLGRCRALTPGLPSRGCGWFGPFGSRSVGGPGLAWYHALPFLRHRPW
ncbi:hypothetical protein CB1_000350012 [Camelus ferus]|nr:hypothetical protein CB1_000350012 [Camelus ferus]